MLTPSRRSMILANVSYYYFWYFYKYILKFYRPFLFSNDSTKQVEAAWEFAKATKDVVARQVDRVWRFSSTSLFSTSRALIIANIYIYSYINHNTAYLYKICTTYNIETKLLKKIGIVVRYNALRHISHLISILVTIDRFPDFDAEPIVHWPAIFEPVYKQLINPPNLYTYIYINIYLHWWRTHHCRQYDLRVN